MITQKYLGFWDFWFYVVGVNVSPADTGNKMISDNLKVRQIEPMSPDEFEAIKKEGAYIRGAAVVTGKVWRGNYIRNYLNGVDLDNQKAIEEICCCQYYIILRNLPDCNARDAAANGYIVVATHTE